ncbi:major facilitator superfamily domain-containing protein [Pisolithus marmoratus]|nr:major facilitator superfamily domain-containing protein [Pisolithus marmoratus]
MSSAPNHNSFLKDKDCGVRPGDVLQASTQDIFSGESFDPVYHAKARLLNDAIQEIGMGKYQWYLFFVCGFGWFADNLIAPGLIYASVIRDVYFSQYGIKVGWAVGLLIGSVVWGVGSDIWGRRWSFNFTLLITGVFALAAGASPYYLTLCILLGLLSTGVGGNLTVDPTIFLEYVPTSHQYLLTVLSIWQAIGQVVGTLVAWPLISDYSCPSNSATCPASSNKGWRYCLFTMGAVIMVIWILRFFVFNLQESPKFLMSCGRDDEAVAAVHRLAAFNGKVSRLTIEHLEEADKSFGPAQGEARASGLKPLFATRKLAYTTCILIVLWALIGLAFPLYDTVLTGSYLTNTFDTVFRDRVILSAVSVPGAPMAGYLVELPIFGRRRTLSIFTVLTGALILASTTAGTFDLYLGWGFSFTTSVMYGVLYALSSELFPTRSRGTGNAIVAAVNRIFGLIALLILYLHRVNVRMVSGGIFISAGFIALLLPFEPRGKASL